MKRWPKGHGHSFGEPGSIQPLGVLAVQGALMVKQFTHEMGAPPILFGHSLGGVLATELVLQHYLPVSGLILSSPAFRVRMSLKNRLKLGAMNAFAPDKVVELPYRPEMLTQDPDKLEESRHDPLIHGYKSARLIQWLIDSGEESIRVAHKIPAKTLALIAGADPVVDPEAIREWVGNTPKGSTTVHEYPDAFHEILNETPSIRDKAISDIVDWLNNLS